MNKTQIFGFWKEHVGDDFPSLHDAQHDKLSSSDAEIIANYLENCPIWIASSGVIKSSIDATEIAGTSSIRTDGLWAWQDTMAYYVRKLRISPPEQFIFAVLKKNGYPPSESDLNLESLEFSEI